MAIRTKLDGLISESRLRKLAGERYFERGLKYFRVGTVARVRYGEDGIAARVIGTEPYVARIWQAGRALRWGCSCPLGAEGAFCKHLVATGLAWRSGHAGDRKAIAEMKRVEALLDPLDRQRLTELIADRAMWDEPFYEELLLAARAIQDSSKQPAKQRKSTIKK